MRKRFLMNYFAVSLWMSRRPLSRQRVNREADSTIPSELRHRHGVIEMLRKVESLINPPWRSASGNAMPVSILLSKVSGPKDVFISAGGARF
ncbi:hypothetical protein [Rhizobium sp. PP-F2F-G48]|uniref:hypothetical protein n=1 Tax=Rhizobium sp. PP-F2F-G48 TaxID=2135651 RepID=UPI001051F7A8|nr:hypothetical protein [Rhizobium sp. PP-F2F-G48]